MSRGESKVALLRVFLSPFRFKGGYTDCVIRSFVPPLSPDPLAPVREVYETG